MMRSLANARLLHFGVACVLYLVYLPAFVVTVFRLLSRQSSMTVFSGNLTRLPIRSWLRSALVIVAILMFTFETSEVILDGVRYMQVRDLPEAAKEIWIKGKWCYGTPEGSTFYCGYRPPLYIPTLVVVGMGLFYYLSIVFLCIVLMKHVAWNALVPMISPFCVHAWMNMLHSNVSFEDHSMSLRASTIEGLATFAIISAFAGYMTYRAWQGQMHSIKLAAGNPQEGRGFFTLFKLIWRDRDGRWHLLSSMALYVVFAVATRLTSDPGPMRAVARLASAIVCMYLLSQDDETCSDTVSDVDYAPLSVAEEANKQETGEASVGGPNTEVVFDVSSIEDKV